LVQEIETYTNAMWTNCRMSVSVDIQNQWETSGPDTRMRFKTFPAVSVTGCQTLTACESHIP